MPSLGKSEPSKITGSRFVGGNNTRHEQREFTCSAVQYGRQKYGLLCKSRPPISFVMSKFQKQNLVKVPFHFVSQQKTESSAVVFDGLGGKRRAGLPGYGVQGVENTGSGGRHGVWKTRGLVENTESQWKTRGLSAKHGGTIFSLNHEVEILLFQIAMKINRRETRFLRAEASEKISNFC